MKAYTETVHSKRFITAFLIVAMTAFLLGWWIFRARENRITELDTSDITIVTDGYRDYLDMVSCENDGDPLTKDNVTVTGWVIRPGEAVKTVSIHVVLRDEETDRYYVLPTSVKTREDVTKALNDGNDYDYSGFSATVPYWKDLDEEKDYAIYALYQLNDEKPVLVDLSATLKTWGKEKA